MGVSELYPLASFFKAAQCHRKGPCACYTMATDNVVRCTAQTDSLSYKETHLGKVMGQLIC